MLRLRLSILIPLIACGPGKADSDTEETGTDGPDQRESVGHSSTPTTTVPGDLSDGPSVPTTGQAPEFTTGEPDRETEGGFTTGDPGPGPIPEPCDPWSENCPEGMKCMPTDELGVDEYTDLRCRPVVPDPQKPGQSCTMQDDPFSGLDDCQLHAMCFDLNDKLQGGCVAMCTGSPGQPVCPVGLECAQLKTGDKTGLLNLCLVPCDPLAPECGSDGVCAPNGSVGFVCMPQEDGVDGSDGEPCDSVNGCDPGNVCIHSFAVPDHCSQEVSECCVPFCNLNDMPSCPGVLDCLPWSDVPPPGLEHVGVCAQQI